ncbi:MAG TPA: DNA-binding protein [Rhodobacteraceae bacterium]|jgi:DNA-binding protein HU-beta|nr:HU family DNA-binding protein [Paracoccaceae bacterium]HBG98883.1 DNA-binding protein [Paracoccaceae bacterium]
MATKPMTKAQLVAALAEEAGMDKKAAASALDALTAIVTREVTNGGAVNLPGIGKVFCRERAARTVRVPGTDRTVDKPADKSVKVTISKSLKDSVNA